MLAIRVLSGNRVYKNKMADALDVVFLINLGVLAIILHHRSTFCLAPTVSASISFALFLCILVYHLHIGMNENISVYAQVMRRVQNIQNSTLTKSTVDTKETIDSNQPKTSPSTSYIEFREILINK